MRSVTSIFNSARKVPKYLYSRFRVIRGYILGYGVYKDPTLGITS